MKNYIRQLMPYILSLSLLGCSGQVSENLEDKVAKGEQHIEQAAPTKTQSLDELDEFATERLMTPMFGICGKVVSLSEYYSCGERISVGERIHIPYHSAIPYKDYGLAPGGILEVVGLTEVVGMFSGSFACVAYYDPHPDSEKKEFLISPGILAEIKGLDEGRWILEEDSFKVYIVHPYQPLKGDGDVGYKFVSVMMYIPIGR